MSLATVLMYRSHMGQRMDGWQAFCKDELLTTNPHTDVAKHEAWLEGFNSAKEEFENGVMSVEMKLCYAEL